MATNRKSMLRDVMNLAWQFVKKNGFTMAAALKTAWANIKLRANLIKGIVKFRFEKVDGTIRLAYGTLKSELLPPTGNGRKANPAIQVYFDTEKNEYRCFKKANLL